MTSKICPFPQQPSLALERPRALSISSTVMYPLDSQASPSRSALYQIEPTSIHEEVSPCSVQYKPQQSLMPTIPPPNSVTFQQINVLGSEISSLRSNAYREIPEGNLSLEDILWFVRSTK